MIGGCRRLVPNRVAVDSCSVGQVGYPSKGFSYGGVCETPWDGSGVTGKSKLWTGFSALDQTLVSGKRSRKFGKIVSGAFTPVLAKHSKSFSLIDCISVGVDRMQRNLDPMRKQVETWQKSELTDVTAKVVIYEAFVEGKLEAPKHLARTVHDLYFEPKYEEFRPRTIWSLSNAFTSAIQGTRSDSAIQGLRPSLVNSCGPVSHSRLNARVGSPTPVVSTTLAQGLFNVILNFGAAFQPEHLGHDFSVAANVECYRR